MISVWLLLSILNLARFSQAFEKSTPNSSICENDALKTVQKLQQELQLKTGIENLRCFLIINQKCQAMSNIEENAADFEPSLDSTTKSPYIPSDCTEAIRLSDRSQGIFKIQIPNSQLEPFNVYCMSDPNGDSYAWTIIQRRIDGSVDFQQPWVEYVRGFGNLEEEFWIGLEKIHELTKSVRQELWIQMVDFQNTKRWAKYNSFSVGNATDSFALKDLGLYTGDAGDSLRAHAGQKFSTKDNDNDEHKGNCTEMATGAWWHKDCHHGNLNGYYMRGTYENGLPGKGVIWDHWRSNTYSLKYVHMAIRPYIPNSCNEAVRLSGRPHGIHKIQVPGSYLRAFNVYCMSDRNGESDAWTLIQRRLNGSVDFRKSWLDFARGFGNLEGEFWLGLEKIHEMTNSKPHELWIEMETFDNVTGWAKYRGFSVGHGKKSFPLIITNESFRGNVSDKMRYHVGKKFSTLDMDNDRSEEINCAEYGAWWHGSCYFSNLNGQYITPDERRHRDVCIEGINWGNLEHCSLKYVHMAIRHYIPSSCNEAVRFSGRPNGVHKIQVSDSNLRPFEAYCMSDPNGDGGAWTLIQRRLDGSVDFGKPWADYARGFGNLEGEFWLGLEKIHEMTKSKPHKLWIQMETFDNVSGWAQYGGFSVGNEKESFPLKISDESFRRNVLDKMRYHVHEKFSTMDIDNDKSKVVNCAQYGAWWHGSCYASNLNGRYFSSDQKRYREGCINGINWGNLEDCSLKYVHMAIRA